VRFKYPVVTLSIDGNPQVFLGAKHGDAQTESLIDDQFQCEEHKIHSIYFLIGLAIVRRMNSITMPYM